MEFERKEKYIVLKISKLSDIEINEVKEKYSRAMTESVVVPSTWTQEYEAAWKLVEDKIVKDTTK